MLAVLDLVVDYSNLVTAPLAIVSFILQFLVPRRRSGGGQNTTRPRVPNKARPILLALILLGVTNLAFVFAPWERLGDPRVVLSEWPPRVIVRGPSDTLHPVQGRVIGVLNPRRLDLIFYARTNQWYIQPYAEQPAADIHSDGSFATQTHDGQEYAALLVRSGYAPPAIANALPRVGGDVIAIIRIQGRVTPGG